MVALKISGRASGSQRRHEAGGAGLSFILMLSMMLVTLSGCGLGIGGSPGKHIGIWQAIRMLDAQHGWASTYLAILRTSDGGAHWQDVTPWQKRSPWGHSATFLTASIAWVVQQGDKDGKTPAQVFGTADGGTSWHSADVPDSISTFTPTSSPYQVARSDVTVSSVSAIDAQHAWILSTRTYTPAHDPDNIRITYTHVLQTSNGGVNWSVLVPDLPGQPGAASSASPSAAHIHWAALVNATAGWLNGPTPSTLLQTQDGGQTWRQRTLPALDAKSVAGGATTQLMAPTFLSADNAILQAVTYGRDKNQAHSFYVTRNGGETWTVTAPLVLPSRVIEGDYLDVTHWSLMAGNSTLYKTADGGQNWTTSEPAMDFQSIRSAHFLTGSTGWAIGDNTPANRAPTLDSDTVTSPVMTVDGGQTWKAVTYSVT